MNDPIHQHIKEIYQVLGCILNYNVDIPEDSLIRQISALAGIPEEKVKGHFQAAREAYLRKGMGL